MPLGMMEVSHEVVSLHIPLWLHAAVVLLMNRNFALCQWILQVLPMSLSQIPESCREYLLATSLDVSPAREGQTTVLPNGALHCKITDNHFDNPARRLQPDPTEPDPDVIPDINEAPQFAQDLQNIADQNAGLSPILRETAF